MNKPIYYSRLYHLKVNAWKYLRDIMQKKSLIGSKSIQNIKSIKEHKKEHQKA